MKYKDADEERVASDEVRKQQRAFYFDTQRSTFSKCLAPGGDCEGRAIRAHSVQNARVMDLLAEAGHVKGVASSIKKDTSTGTEGPVLDFRNFGRNDASTFEGFCAHHDSAIFRKLDSESFDSSNDEQLYLLAYRSISHTVHAVMNSGMRSQMSYQQRIRVGWDTGNKPEVAGEMALHYLMQGYELWNYRELLSEGLVKADFSRLTHHVLTVEHGEPSFAASACFNYAPSVQTDTASYMAINVFPISTKESVAILSYIPEDSKSARELLAPILEAGGEYQKYLISKLVLAHCQNFYTSPRLFNKWPKAKVDEILSFFHRTLYKNILYDNEALFLFG